MVFTVPATGKSFLPRLLGALLSLAAGALLIDAIQDPTLLAQALPAFQGMGLNTMLAFVLSGVGLLAQGRPRLIVGMGMLIAALALTTLWQALSGQYPDTGPWQMVLNTSGDMAWPGKMSLGAALALLAAGCVFMALPRASGGTSLVVVHGLLGGVFLVGLIGLMGQAMGIFMFTSRFPVKALMSVPTATGLMLLSIGLYRLAGLSERLGLYYQRYPDRRILSISIFLLLVLLLIGGLASSTIIRRHALGVFQRTLADSLRTNRLLFEQSVAHAEQMGRLAISLAHRDRDTDWLRANMTPPGAESIGAVSALWRDGPGAGREMLYGAPARQAVLAVALRDDGASRLLWRDGWLVEVRQGEFGVEVRISELKNLFHYAVSLGPTADISIFTARGRGIEFLYTRLHPEPFFHPSRLDLDGEPLPASLALLGRTGTMVAKDYRDKVVVAAFSPLFGARMGMVQKVDAEELFDALRHEFWKIVLFLLFLSTGGALLLYRYVLPLARRLRQTQTSLSDSLRKNELILQCAGEGIYGLDAQGRVSFVNTTAEQLLGYTLADLSQAPVHTIIHHSRRDGSPYPAEQCPIVETFRDGQPHRQEAEVFWCKDGHPLDVEYVSAPIQEGGQVTGAVVVFSDITARRQAEATLREHEAHLARAQAQGKLGSWWLDVPNDVLEWSAECYRIFALPLGTPLNYQAFLACVHADDRVYVDRAWRAAMAGEPYDIQHRIVADGQIRWVRERADLEFAPDGTLLRGIGTAQDITELKHHEDELLRSRQSLRELAAHHEKIREEERSRIAREIHDELGQYLTALRMDTAMLNIRFGQDNPDLRGIIADMKQTIDTTIGVVRNVASALRPGALDMGLVSAAEWLLAGFQERTGIRCHLNAPREDLGLDNERATAAFRILQESLTNVARYAKAGAVDVQIELVDAVLEMEVRDDGVGFDPLEVRGRKTFGLMGIRERALMFGGESRIDSEPGAGTTLRVRIPLSAKGL